MSRKKKAQEELMKTHVLNLNEIRDAEKKDKKEKIRKMPKRIVFIGIILIISGFSISSVLAYMNAQKRNHITYKKDKSKLTCISNLNNNYYKTKIHTETTYRFENGKLVESVSKVTNTPDGEINYLEILKNDIVVNTAYMNDIYVDKKNGVDYKQKMNNINELYIEFTLNYNYFKDITKQSIINNYCRVPIHTNKETYNDVKQKSESTGALCN
ncbi:MAG: hypothetical protein IK997_04280 [Bacilli bacterium]|nr:hypothetical protein [Bacilli bacterium]